MNAIRLEELDRLRQRDARALGLWNDRIIELIRGIRGLNQTLRDLQKELDVKAESEAPEGKVRL